MVHFAVQLFPQVAVRRWCGAFRSAAISVGARTALSYIAQVVPIIQVAPGMPGSFSALKLNSGRRKLTVPTVDTTRLQLVTVRGSYSKNFEIKHCRQAAQAALSTSPCR